MERLLELLKSHYNYDQFRPGQREVIESVISGRDTVAIMPTGGGKSLCFQLPALHFEGITIVISPLIALMKDQVDSLTEARIPATFINSSISGSDLDERIEGVRSGRYKLLYVAPERFNNQEFIDLLGQVRVSLFAIDEAHCISEWGHDFRPSYLRIKDVRKALNNPLTVALTATATPHVRTDIINQLNLADPQVFVSGFDRPNIFFSARVGGKQEKLWELLKFVKSQRGSGIVYAGTRAAADEIAGILQAHDIPTINYHAGLDAEDRSTIQDAFMNGEYRVIVATNAFGMGIDKSDIRFVVHYTLPGTMEAYYQEAGRAGRDGKPSICMLLYNPADRYLREFFITGDNPPRHVIEEVYQILLNQKEQPILLTYSEIAEQLSVEVPEMAVGTALNILERHGYISTANENEKAATIRLIVGDAHERLGSRASTKKLVLQHFIDAYGDALSEGVQFSLDKEAEAVDAKKDSFVRALRALKKEGLIEYQPPFRGKEIYVDQVADPRTLAIDFRALEAKLNADMEKLNTMEGYAYTQECRRAYILNYFGEGHHANFCGNCDNCIH